jgi:PAS domain S-box-containing protein
MQEVEALKRRIEREKRARLESERLLEHKSRELFEANKKLSSLAEKLSEEYRQASLELLAAQKIALLGSMVHDIKTGKTTFSDSFYILFGLDPAHDVLNINKLVDVIHPDDRTNIKQLLNKAKSPSELDPHYNMQFRIISADGNQRWIDAHGEARLDTENTPIQLIATLQDITERKIIERELMDARDAAEEAYRTKSRFLAAMSHEIRTPLNGVLGALQLIVDSDLDQGQRDHFEIALSSAESLHRVTNDIIDLSRLETGRLELELAPFDIISLVQEISEFWSPMANSKGLSMKISIDRGIPRNVIGDSSRIRQVLNNYVYNAIKFTDHGSVIISAELNDTVKSRNDDDITVQLEVQDTGIGISKENQKHLFEDFSQVHDRKKDLLSGAGLGLAIARELAQRMAGSVGVRSTPGAGSNFWVRLPLKASKTAILADDSIQKPSRLPPLLNVFGKAPRVLLAEDVIANQTIAKAMLSRFGCQVEVVDNGLEAVNALKSTIYDVVLMDVAMPLMNGVEASRQIRVMSGENAGVPIIGQTAYALQEEISSFLEAGMNEVINKPLKRDILHRALSAALQPDKGVKGATPINILDSTTDADLDKTVLDELKDSLAPDQICNLVEQLIIDVEANAKLGATSAEKDEIDKLASASHALKGLGASFGNSALEKLADDIQRACQQGDSLQATSMTLSSLMDVCKNFASALRIYRRSLGKNINV